MTFLTMTGARSNAAESWVCTHREGGRTIYPRACACACACARTCARAAPPNTDLTASHHHIWGLPAATLLPRRHWTADRTMGARPRQPSTDRAVGRAVGAGEGPCSWSLSAGVRARRRPVTPLSDLALLRWRQRVCFCWTHWQEYRRARYSLLPS